MSKHTKRGMPRAEEARAEVIRRREVSRALARINLSPGKEEAVERLSRSLVGKLLRGPVSKVRTRAENRPTCGGPASLVWLRPAGEKAHSEVRRHPCES